MTASELAAQWRAKADEYMRISKAYKCRSMDGARMGYVKSALTLRVCADELEAIKAEPDETLG